MIVTVTRIDDVEGGSVENARAVTCEVCSESFVNDYIVNKEPRDMFLVEPAHMKVCSDCLPDFDFWEGS